MLDDTQKEVKSQTLIGKTTKQADRTNLEDGNERKRTDHIG